MLFIVNATAGSGKADLKFNKVREYLASRRISYDVAYTEYVGHATKLARAAAFRGEKTIVAVGGDGTVREVASALIGTDIALGILPFGTGNDFSKPLKIPGDIRGATDCLLRGYTEYADSCRINNRLFVNVAGIGFDVDVLVETARFKNGFLNIFSYILGILSAMLHKKPMKLRVECNDTVYEDDYLLISIANGTHIGGGMAAAPNASPFDGLLDLVLIKDVSLLKFMRLLPKFIKGTHIMHTDVVSVLRTDSVTITPIGDIEYPVQADGEIDEVTPVHFELLKRSLKVILPEAKDEN